MVSHEKEVGKGEKSRRKLVSVWLALRCRGSGGGIVQCSGGVL